MDRVEAIGSDTMVLRTRQLGPNSWCCDVYERHPSNPEESFVFEDFGETESEAIEMALYDAHEPIQHLNHYHHGH
jgi:hypothetical protein